MTRRDAGKQTLGTQMTAEGEDAQTDAVDDVTPGRGFVASGVQDQGTPWS